MTKVVTPPLRLSPTLLALLLAACGGGAPLTQPPPTVELATVTQVGSARDLRLSGTLEAERSIALSFQGTGTVEEVLVREGQPVRRGQILARLSSDSVEHQLGIARARVAQAEDASRRLEPLHRSGTVPEVKWVEVQEGLAQARHAEAIARKQVEDATLRAPEAGVIARRNVEPGANAVPALASAFTLVRLDTMLATVPVPEREIPRLRAGQPASVVVAALDRQVTGTVREIGVIADALTRTYPVKIALENPDGALRVGMVVDARVPVGGGARSLAVPRAAVRVDGDGVPVVFVVGKDGKASRRAVKIEGYVGELTALSAGVAEGEQVVVSGTPMLADGVPVRVAALSVEEK